MKEWNKDIKRVDESQKRKKMKINVKEENEEKLYDYKKIRKTRQIENKTSKKLSHTKKIKKN